MCGETIKPETKGHLAEAKSKNTYNGKTKDKACIRNGKWNLIAGFVV